MRARTRIVAVTALATAALVAIPASAYAAQFTTNTIYCAGPYTTGKGTSRAISPVGSVGHVAYDGNGSITKIQNFPNATTWAYRTSYGHGSGTTYFKVAAVDGQIDTLNTFPGCQYLG